MSESKTTRQAALQEVCDAIFMGDGFDWLSKKSVEFREGYYQRHTDIAAILQDLKSEQP